MSDKRLYKIAGTPGSDGLNSCPTVIGFGDDEVILQGYKLDADTRHRLNIPDGEDAIVIPRSIYAEGARRVMEGK